MKKTLKKFTLGIAIIVSAILLFNSLSNVVEAVENQIDSNTNLVADPLIADGEFVYGPELHITNFHEFIKQDFPEYSPHVDLLVNLSHLHSINPKAVLTIMKLYPDNFDVNSEEYTKNVEQLYQELFNHYYEYGHQDVYLDKQERTQYYVSLSDEDVPISKNANSATFAVVKSIETITESNSDLFYNSIPEIGSEQSGFVDKYSQFFEKDPRVSDNEVIPPNNDKGLSFLEGLIKVYASTPPDTDLKFPYPQGESWTFNGIHSNTGSGSDRSSIDFSPDFAEWPISSDLPVVAAAEGVGVENWIHSCAVLLRHKDNSGNYNGWYTRYLHLEGVLVDEDETVQQNEQIAIIAKTKSQAECLSSISDNSSHVHFTLLYNGELITSPSSFTSSLNDLNQVVLSGWKIYHDGSSNYSADCDDNFFYSDDDDDDTWDAGEAKKCPFTDTILNPDCVPLSTGDWTITSSCSYSGSYSAPNDVNVMSPAQLTITNGSTLNIDFTQNGLFVEDGAGVLVKNGGSIE